MVDERRIDLLEKLRRLDYRIIDNMHNSDTVARLQEEREELMKELHTVLAAKSANAA